MGQFILGDCMNEENGLPSYPDKYFDLAIVDPPYGIGEDGSKTQGRRVGSDKWKKPLPSTYKAYHGNDKEPPDQTYFKELIRVSKNQIVWGANHFIDKIGVASPCWIVWDKKYETDGSDFADCELAWTSFKSAVRKAKMAWIGFAHINHGEKRLHPNQKPISLYRWLLENYAKPGQLILDTHVGSASSLIACESMGFDYVGFEIDPDYYAAANNRMSKGIQAVLI